MLEVILRRFFDKMWLGLAALVTIAALAGMAFCGYQMFTELHGELQNQALALTWWMGMFGFAIFAGIGAIYFAFLHIFARS